MSKEHTYSGDVVKKRVAPGSKSDREAVCLATPSGQSFVLRRDGGPSFQDPVLDALVGKRIEAVGEERGYVLIVRSWREIDEKRGVQR
jgi:hypothetical protein